MAKQHIEIVSFRLSSAVKQALDQEIKERKSRGEKAAVGETVEQAIWRELRKPGQHRATRNKLAHELLDELMDQGLPAMRAFVNAGLELLVTWQRSMGYAAGGDMAGKQEE